MSRDPERRRFRSDDELRAQQQQDYRAWMVQQRRAARERARDNAVERDVRVDQIVHEYRSHADITTTPAGTARRDRVHGAVNPATDHPQSPQSNDSHESRRREALNARKNLKASNRTRSRI
jgi:hypothetical protein